MTDSISSELLALLFLNKGPPGPAGQMGPTGPTGATGATGATGPFIPPQSGIFFDETAVINLYVSTTGNDVTGDGLTPGTAWATPNHALKQFPWGWTSDVQINVAAGTYTGNQTWTLPVCPGGKTTSNGTGRVVIVGDVSSAVALTGGNVGALVAGKLTTYDFNVGAYAAAVTDGSHFLYRPGAGTYASFTGLAVEASVSPNLRVIASSTTALTLPSLATWDANFVGTVTINTPYFARAAGQWFGVYFIRFQATLTVTGVNVRACRVDLGGVFTDSPLSNVVSMLGTQTITCNSNSQTSMSGVFFVAGGCNITGPLNLLSGCKWKGAMTPGQLGKLQIGGSSGTITTATQPGILRSFGLCDFEGTGNAVVMRGGWLTGNGAAISCVVTGGAALVMTAGAMVYGSAALTWAGTGDASSIVSQGAQLLTAGGFACTNSAAPGTDITVGELAAQATAVRPTTAPLHLSRYT